MIRSGSLLSLDGESLDHKKITEIFKIYIDIDIDCDYEIIVIITSLTSGFLQFYVSETFIRSFIRIMIILNSDFFRYIQMKIITNIDTTYLNRIEFWFIVIYLVFL